MTESVDNAAVAPDEAFSLLGHDLRIRIIQALWEVDDNPVPFSDLRERADVTDSGQFNYHLGALVGTFVRQTKTGYKLTYAGQQVVCAILDGTYTKHASIQSFEIDAACSFCGSSLEANYEAEFFAICCPNASCEDLDQLAGLPLPPGALDGRSRENLVEMAYHWLRAKFLLMRNGICPYCAGTMSQSITEDIEAPDHEVGVGYDCQQCMYEANSTLMTHFIAHPVVVSFYHDHGVDLTEGWEVRVPSDSESTNVRSRNPWRIECVIPLFGDKLQLVVDEDLQVVEHRHI